MAGAAYITRAGLEQRFGATEILQLLDRDGDGVADAGVLDAAVADATARIDGALSERYTLPLNPVPALVTSIAARLVRFYLYEDEASEAVTSHFKHALKTLDMIAMGHVNLCIDNAAPQVAGSPQVDAPRRIFGRHSGHNSEPGGY